MIACQWTTAMSMDDSMSGDSSMSSSMDDCEAKAAPTNDMGYIPAATAIEWANVEDMPEECGGIFWNSDGTVLGSYTQVPDSCCDVNAGAEVLVSLTEAWPAYDNCFVLDPNGDMSVYGTWAGGCSNDGEFFYGEKCGGSDFGPFAESAYGACTQPEEYCSCIGTVETMTPGCFSIATIIPPAELQEEGFVQNAVFLQVDGCITSQPTEPNSMSMDYSMSKDDSMSMDYSMSKDDSMSKDYSMSKER
eukprot:TRINITY_DN2458_c0_g1_i1.p1 TRINITY_DN2458_c0_g1~~TRINITY_DN2458_c0_g1_i1.p1  ORF type:complete len:247 (-),score=36.00 TRINITY_DN2458_c0_g1_i1:109-849(-)